MSGFFGFAQFPGVTETRLLLTESNRVVVSRIKLSIRMTKTQFNPFSPIDESKTLAVHKVPQPSASHSTAPGSRAHRSGPTCQPPSLVCSSAPPSLEKRVKTPGQREQALRNIAEEADEKWKCGLVPSGRRPARETLEKTEKDPRTQQRAERPTRVPVAGQ